MRPLRGQEVVVSVRRGYPRRSLSANAYLWGVCYVYLCNWSGHDDQEMHDAMKVMFLSPRVIDLPNGDTVTLPPSSRVLDSAQFAEFVEKVKRFAAENGVTIPEPHEVDFT